MNMQSLFKILNAPVCSYTLNICYYTQNMTVVCWGYLKPRMTLSAGWKLCWPQHLQINNCCRSHGSFSNNYRHESPAAAMVTHDSNACMKGLGNKSKLSRKPYPRTKHHVDQQTDCEVMAIFGHPRWPSAAILDFWNSKVAPLDRSTL